jgi:hypothetical protein
MKLRIFCGTGGDDLRIELLLWTAVAVAIALLEQHLRLHCNTVGVLTEVSVHAAA